jgi:hypothetical protein
MQADISEGRRAEQRIADGVQQDVGVAMAVEAERGRDFDPADNQFSTFGEGMDVYTYTYAHAAVGLM